MWSKVFHIHIHRSKWRKKWNFFLLILSKVVWIARFDWCCIYKLTSVFSFKFFNKNSMWHDFFFLFFVNVIVEFLKIYFTKHFLLKTFTFYTFGLFLAIMNISLFFTFRMVYFLFVRSCIEKILNINIGQMPNYHLQVFIYY